MTIEKKLNLVVLHGWGQDKKSWGLFVNSFGEDKVIALDLPGFGDEQLVSDDWGISEYAEWVEQRIIHLKLNNVILLGHSFGGRVSSYIAGRNPVWLRGLVLVGAPCIHRPSKVTQHKIAINKLLKKFVPYKLRQQLLGNKNLVSADTRGLGKVFRKTVIFDQTDLLPNIKVPTLLIWGENDEIVPMRIGKEMQTLIPNSELVVLDNLGHHAHLQNPNLFYGTVKRFIENL